MKSSLHKLYDQICLWLIHSAVITGECNCDTSTPRLLPALLCDTVDLLIVFTACATVQEYMAKLSFHYTSSQSACGFTATPCVHLNHCGRHNKSASPAQCLPSQPPRLKRATWAKTANGSIHHVNRCWEDLLNVTQFNQLYISGVLRLKQQQIMLIMREREGEVGCVYDFGEGGTTTCWYFSKHPTDLRQLVSPTLKAPEN